MGQDAATINDADAGLDYTGIFEDSSTSIPLVETALDHDVVFGKTIDSDGSDDSSTGRDDKKGQTAETKGQDGTTQGKDSQGQGGETDQKGKDKNLDDRFDQHPRFVELNTKLAQEREGRIKLEAQLEMVNKTLTQLQQARPAEETPKPSFKDISQMSKEDLAEWMVEDPLGYSANLYQQIRHELTQEFDTREKTRNEESERKRQFSTIDSTYKDFAKKNEDFQPLWDSGEIKKFIEEHPGHNAMSAYHEITYQKRLEQATAKATKEAEEKTLAAIKAKSGAVTLGAGTSPTSRTGAETEFDNTQAKGGLKSVMTNWLVNARRASAQ